MPIYLFRCTHCGQQGDWEMSIHEVTPDPMLPCSCSGDADNPVETPHQRIYSFGLGPVPGGGGSPGRFGSYKKKG